MPGRSEGSGTGWERLHHERDHSRPDVELRVGCVAVVRGADTHLGGCLVEWQPEHGRRLELLRRRSPRVCPAAGEQLLAERFEGGELLVCAVDSGRSSEHDDGAVVDGVLEHGACEHDPVEQCRGEARVDAVTHRPQRPAGGRAVDVDVVADACVQRGDHERLPVLDEAEVADQGGVEDRVDAGTVVASVLGHALHPCPGARGGVGPARHVRRRYPTPRRPRRPTRWARSPSCASS